MMDAVRKQSLKVNQDEIFRYLLVGGTAFLIDTGILYLTKTYVFADMGDIGILLAAALGFIAGLIYNYSLSILFVFEKASAKVKGKQLWFFLIFAVIGFIGLALTEIGMYLGINLIGSQYYLLVKVFVAAIVLMWNYIGRKILLFK